MTSIQSKINPFYFALRIFTSLFIIGIGIFLIILFNHKMNAFNSNKGNYLWLFLGIYCLLMSIYLFVKYCIDLHSFSINETAIVLNKKEYKWEEVKKIELIGEDRFAGSSFMKVIKIECNDEIEIVIYDKFYKNISEIKSFLKSVVIEKGTYTILTPEKVYNTAIEGEYFESFKSYFSFRILISWFSLLCFFAVILNIQKFPQEEYIIGLFLAILFLILFFLQSNGLHYFKCSDNYLMIKNYHFFWYQKIYKLSDILECELKSYGKGGLGMIITTKDYNPKTFYADSLWDKDWKALITYLEGRNIPFKTNGLMD
ncbi:MAG: hypothetical protein K2Q03_05610 [Sphingobacteriaceae bacterium]|nr:hypothetical protein [Sphingobacteriaceae bacterium]